MYTVFLSGGIASGKSTVAGITEQLGATRIDLDQVSRRVTQPGSACLPALAQAFGADVLDPSTGELRRSVLASRAFSSEESCALLEKIEMPFITAELERELGSLESGGNVRVCVVEVPLLDRVEGMLDQADEVVCVTVPDDIRLARALGRGMSEDDYERRLRWQPGDDYLRAHSRTEFVNDGDLASLAARVGEWWYGLASEGVE